MGSSLVPQLLLGGRCARVVLVSFWWVFVVLDPHVPGAAVQLPHPEVLLGFVYRMLLLAFVV